MESKQSKFSELQSILTSQVGRLNLQIQKIQNDEVENQKDRQDEDPFLNELIDQVIQESKDMRKALMHLKYQILHQKYLSSDQRLARQQFKLSASFKITQEKYHKYYSDFLKSIETEVKQLENSLLQEYISEFDTKELGLIYQGSSNEFSALKFHEKCDVQGGFVVFILSENGEIFGGYTSIGFKVGQEDGYSHQQCLYKLLIIYFEDKKAFVFSLSKKTIHKQNLFIGDDEQEQFLSMCYIKEGLVCFGGGPDINIGDKCDQNEKANYCYLGFIYDPPAGLISQSAEANEYLAGSRYFRVIEIEVYKVC